MNGLTWFGLIAVTAMMIFYIFEQRSPIYVLGFAVACLMGSIYGFLQGAWPFGIVECIWSIYAVRRWWLQQRVGSRHAGRLNLQVNTPRNGDKTYESTSGESAESD